LIRSSIVKRAIAVLGLALASWAMPARAQPEDATRQAARLLGKEAAELYQQARYAEALEKFKRADDLAHVPTTGLYAARCLEKLGRLVEAEAKYSAVMRMQVAADALPVHKKAIAEAATEHDALVPRIPRL
jgi:tetratricopeptide (TPR) repeat protein